MAELTIIYNYKIGIHLDINSSLSKKSIILDFFFNYLYFSNKGGGEHGGNCGCLLPESDIVLIRVVELDKENKKSALFENTKIMEKAKEKGFLTVLKMR